MPDLFSLHYFSVPQVGISDFLRHPLNEAIDGIRQARIWKSTMQ